MNNKKDENALDLADAVSGILGVLNPIFSLIPIVTYGIRRAMGKTSDKDIVERIKKLEKKT